MKYDKEVPLWVCLLPMIVIIAGIATALALNTMAEQRRTGETDIEKYISGYREATTTTMPHTHKEKQISNMSCKGRCEEKAPGGCWCDKLSLEHGDYCKDNCLECGNCIETTTTTTSTTREKVENKGINNTICFFGC